MSVLALQTSVLQMLHANVMSRPDRSARIVSMSLSTSALHSGLLLAHSLRKPWMITEGWLKLARTMSRVWRTCISQNSTSFSSFGGNELFT